MPVRAARRRTLLVLELVPVPLAVGLVRRLQRGNSAAGDCSTSPFGPLTRNCGGSPASCTTASCRTSLVSPTSWMPRGSAARPALPTGMSETCPLPRRPAVCAPASDRCGRSCSTSTRPTSSRRDSGPRSPTSPLRRQRTS